MAAALAQGACRTGTASLTLFSLRRWRKKEGKLGYAPKVLAVTGTNGKTTVHRPDRQRLVERAGQSVAVAGNIGPTLLDTLTASARWTRMICPQVWVLAELSSFQLHNVSYNFEPTRRRRAQPDAGPPGLARQACKPTRAAKARVFGSTALMVLNRDDPVVMAHAARPPSPKGGKSRAASRYVDASAPTCRSGPGDFGLEVVNGIIWLARAMEADETTSASAGEAAEETCTSSA